MEPSVRKQIKTLVDSHAWNYIEEMFRDEILEGRKPINFKTEGKTADIIAIEVIAREMAAKIVDKTLRKIRAIKAEQEFEKESYK